MGEFVNKAFHREKICVKPTPRQHITGTWVFFRTHPTGRVWNIVREFNQAIDGMTFHARPCPARHA